MSMYNFGSKKILKKDSPVPLYIQLKEIIKEQIAEGVLRPQMPLPSERELCKIYDISHITVRQALVELTKEGFLFRVPGRGTFVKGKESFQKVKEMPLGLVIPEEKGNLSSPFVSEILLGVKSITIEYGILIYFYFSGIGT